MSLPNGAPGEHSYSTTTGAPASAAPDVHAQLRSTVDMATAALQALAALQNRVASDSVDKPDDDDALMLANPVWTAPSDKVSWRNPQSNRYRYEFAESVLTQVKLLQTSIESEDLDPVGLLAQLRAIEINIVRQMKNIRMANDPKNPHQWNLITAPHSFLCFRSRYSKENKCFLFETKWRIEVILTFYHTRNL